MSCTKIPKVKKGKPLEPHLYAAKDTKNQVMYLYIQFEKDSRYPFLESCECYLPGRDPEPYELYTDQMKTRSVRVTVSKTTGKRIPDSGGYIAISIPLKELCQQEKFAYVDIDHSGATHGGKGTIHWP